MGFVEFCWLEDRYIYGFYWLEDEGYAEHRLRPPHGQGPGPMASMGPGLCPRGGLG